MGAIFGNFNIISANNGYYSYTTNIGMIADLFKDGKIMTVKELIEELNKVENKEEKVLVFSNCEWEEVTVVINPNNESVGLFNGDEK